MEFDIWKLILWVFRLLILLFFELALFHHADIATSCIGHWCWSVPKIEDRDLGFKDISICRYCPSYAWDV